MTTNEPPILTGCAVLPPMNGKRKPPNLTPATKPKHSSKSRDRFTAMNNFIDFAMGGLTRNEIAVWFVLFRDCRNEIAATAQTDIARRAGISDRTVRRVVRRLENRGRLKTVYRGGLQRGLSRYRVIPMSNGVGNDQAARQNTSRDNAFAIFGNEATQQEIHGEERKQT